MFKILVILLSIGLVTSQTGITNEIRLTPDPHLVLITFDKDPTQLLSNSIKLQKNVNISASLDGNSITLFYTLSYLTENNLVAALTITDQSIKYGTTIDVVFPFTNPSNSYYFKNPKLSLKLVSYDSTASLKYVDMFEIVNYSFSIIWWCVAVVSLYFAPEFGFLLHSKLLLETMDILKMSNIELNTFASTFFKTSNNRNGALIFFNIFGISMGGDEIKSGLVKNENYVNYFNREKDLAVYSTEQLFKYYNFPLFVDNYGTQICIMLLLLAFLGMYSLYCYFDSKKKYAENKKKSSKLKVILKYNLLITFFFGSSASLCYYSIIQIIASANSAGYGSIYISLALAIIFLLPYIYLLIYFTLNLIRLANNEIVWFGSKYMALQNLYKKGHSKYGLEFLLLQLRSLFIGILVLIPSLSPLVQSLLSLTFSLGYLGYLLWTKPFVQQRYLTSRCILEGFFLLYLVGLFGISVASISSYNSSSWDQCCTLMVVIWILFPVVSTVLASSELIIIYFRVSDNKSESLNLEAIKIGDQSTIDVSTEKNTNSITGASEMAGDDERMHSKKQFTKKNFEKLKYQNPRYKQNIPEDYARTTHGDVMIDDLDASNFNLLETTPAPKNYKKQLELEGYTLKKNFNLEPRSNHRNMLVPEFSTNQKDTFEDFGNLRKSKSPSVLRIKDARTYENQLRIYGGEYDQPIKVKLEPRLKNLDEIPRGYTETMQRSPLKTKYTDDNIRIKPSNSDLRTKEQITKQKIPTRYDDYPKDTYSPNKRNNKEYTPPRKLDNIEDPYPIPPEFNSQKRKNLDTGPHKRELFSPEYKKQVDETKKKIQEIENYLKQFPEEWDKKSPKANTEQKKFSSKVVVAPQYKQFSPNKMESLNYIIDYENYQEYLDKNQFTQISPRADFEPIRPDPKKMRAFDHQKEETSIQRPQKKNLAKISPRLDATGKSFSSKKLNKTKSTLMKKTSSALMKKTSSNLLHRKQSISPIKSQKSKSPSASPHKKGVISKTARSKSVIDTERIDGSKTSFNPLNTIDSVEPFEDEIAYPKTQRTPRSPIKKKGEYYSPNIKGLVTDRTHNARKKNAQRDVFEVKNLTQKPQSKKKIKTDDSYVDPFEKNYDGISQISNNTNFSRQRFV